jgi:hypothetical protein
LDDGFSVDARQAVAIGWTEGVRGPGLVRGTAARRGSTAFIGRTVVTGPVGRRVPVRLSMTGTVNFTQQGYGTRMVSPVGPLVVRLTLPDGDVGSNLDRNHLAVTAPGAVEVWSNGHWQSLSAGGAPPPGLSPITGPPNTPPTIVTSSGQVIVLPNGASSGGSASAFGGQATGGVQAAALPSEAASSGVVWLRINANGYFGSDAIFLEVTP